MADVKFSPPAAPIQTAQRKAHQDRLRLVRANQTAATVKVYACSAEVHAVVKHPNGTKFRGEFGTATEWPHDNFTHRRLKDGTVSLKAVEARGEPDPALGVREAARLNAPDPNEIGQVMPVSAQQKPEPESQPEPKPKPGPRPNQQPERQPEPAPAS